MQVDGGFNFFQNALKTVMANDKRPAEFFAKAIDVLCKQSRKQGKLQHLSYTKSQTGWSLLQQTNEAIQLRSYEKYLPDLFGRSKNVETIFRKWMEISRSRL